MSGSLVKPHKSFWFIAAFALLWNVMGTVNFFAMTLMGSTDAMPAWWNAVIETRPTWATAAMGVGGFAGIAGTVLLLMRRHLAIPVLALALVATIIVVGQAATVRGAGISPGPRQVFEAIILPILFGAFLIWYARMARGKSWLRA